MWVEDLPWEWRTYGGMEDLQGDGGPTLLIREVGRVDNSEPEVWQEHWEFRRKRADVGYKDCTRGPLTRTQGPPATTPSRTAKRVSLCGHFEASTLVQIHISHHLCFHRL